VKETAGNVDVAVRELPDANKVAYHKMGYPFHELQI